MIPVTMPSRPSCVPFTRYTLRAMLVATCLASVSPAFAYNSTRETELLGMHTAVKSNTPAYYNTSRPASVGRNVMPLYPERFSADAAKPAPLETVDVAIPTAPRDVAAPSAPAPQLAALPADTLADNGSIQMAMNDASSPLAMPVKEMRLPPPPSNDVIRAYNATQPAANPIPENDLQPIARPVPVAAPVAAPAPIVPMQAKAPNADIIEPGISYAPDPGMPAPLTNAAAPKEVPDAPAVLGTLAPNTAPAMQPKLSATSKQVLAKYPPRLGQAPATAPGKFKVDRVSPDIVKIVEPNKVEASYEAAGIKIEVRRAGLDTNYELNNAYDALMAGNTTEAINTYRDILSVEPNNQEALFGLAATLHRLGVTDKARPLYARLLQVNPQHREALNNYLSIAGDEAPQEALLELEQLRLRNPDFSPIPAQMGSLYARMGQFSQARSMMMTAIQLSPENLVYQYNLAVMLDQQGEYADASALYASLLKAKQSGATLPVDADKIQKRYNFLSNNMARDLRVSSLQ